eukprot:8712574-Ditylum_brightwellii.AAC.1
MPEKGNGKLDKSSKKKVRPKDEWKFIKPKPGEALTKEVNGKTYHWCEDHQAWVIHNPKDCTLRQQRLAKEGKGGVTFASIAASGKTSDEKIKEKKMMEQAFSTI